MVQFVAVANSLPGVLQYGHKSWCIWSQWFQPGLIHVGSHFCARHFCALGKVVVVASQSYTIYVLLQVHLLILLCEGWS